MKIMPYCACVVVFNVIVFVLFGGGRGGGWWLWVTMMPSYVLVQKHHCRRRCVLIEEGFLSFPQSENGDRDNVNDDDDAYHDHFDMI